MPPIAARPTEQLGVHPVALQGGGSTALAKHVLAGAHEDVAAELARQIREEDDWRHRYVHHYRRMTELAVTDPAGGFAAARVGLRLAQNAFAFTDEHGTRPLVDAVRNPKAATPRTITTQGDGDRVLRLEVPEQGHVLADDALRRRLDEWVSSGAVEPAFADAVRLVVDNPDWLDLRDTAFGLLGAAAEMSPAFLLLRWGATVAAVDLPRPAPWARLHEAVASSAGRLLAPVAEGSDGPGLDLLADTPAVRDWLSALQRPLVVGNYGYLDGLQFVRLTMAVDAVTSVLLEQDPNHAVAYLATPTDVFAVPAPCVHRAGLNRGGLLGAVAKAAHTLHDGLFVPIYQEPLPTPDGPVGIADLLIVQQGPNYAFAKRLQRWRAAVAKGDGHLASAHVAPPTRTVSVVKNTTLAAAYDGAGPFGVTVFQPATTRALMAAALVHDLRNPTAAARPEQPLASTEHLLMHEAAHGGLWHVGWEARTGLGLSVALGAPRALTRRARARFSAPGR